MSYTPFTPANITPSATPPTAFAIVNDTPSSTAPTAFTPVQMSHSSTAPTTPFTPGMVIPDLATFRAIATAPVGTSLVSLTPGPNTYVRYLGALWELAAGTHADSPATGFIQPTDYNAISNQKYWVSVASLA